jgi:uncharacterized protein (DUF1501 family)
MINRRQLLKRSVLLSLSPVVPTFLTRTAQAAGNEKDTRILVVIHLEGGNDGLNTVVPYRDENYARLRPKLHVKNDQLIKLNDEIGLHSAMRPAAELLEDGRFSIIQGVGYPISDRSHFVSMAVWHSAQLEAAETRQNGWLGRALDIQAKSHNAPHGVFVGTGSVPAALWGARSNTASVTSIKDLALTAPAHLLQSAASGTTGELAKWVSDASQNAFSTTQRLTALAARDSALRTAGYPHSPLAEQLRLVAQLIRTGSTTRVFYTLQPGYDTHAAQLVSHGDLLQTLAEALQAFLTDLKSNGLESRVLTLVFSEFGRRVEENGSAGTDHGAAAPIFLAGPKMAAGIIGPTPNLAKLENGDVKVAIDFRRVYASVLDQWMGMAPKEVLKADFEQLRLFNT